MMEMIACTCDGLPAHDHWVRGKKPSEMTDEEMAPYRSGEKVFSYVNWDEDDIGRVWVDWKAVAKGLMALGRDESV